MKKILLSVFAVALFGFSQTGKAQMSLTTMGTATTIDFDNTLAGVNNGAYAGAGFESVPTVGQLNSNAWATTGMSDGALVFGGSRSLGDNARGASTGGVSSGGFYAFEVSTGNFAFGIQPGGSDFTPGTLTLRATNSTGTDADSMKIEYTLYFNNNEARSCNFDLSISTDSTVYTAVTTLNDTSDLAADALGFVAINKSITVSASVANGGRLFLRWSSDDIAGSGSRDEIAIDNISITPIVAAAAPLSASAVGTNISCNGANDGAIDLTATGGTAPYTYAWSNAATTEDLSGLAAGTYNVTVTDAASATTTASASISQPSAIVPSIFELNPISCNGNTDGILVASASGGSGGYSYAWSNAVSGTTNLNIGAGRYTVTVTDNSSCSDTVSYLLSDPAAIGIAGNINNVTTNGGSDGSITLTITNGSAPFTYSWSNSATTKDVSGLAAGTYTVQVTDNGNCINSESFTVTQPSSITITKTSQTDVLCNADATGAIDLTISGGTTPYTYVWSNAATTEDLSGITAGNYNITVTDASSTTAVSSYTITEPTAIVASGIITNVSSNGGSNGAVDVSVSGGVTPYAYSWSNGSTTEDVMGLISGSYSQTITDANGCTSVSPYIVTQPAALVASITSQTNVSCNGGANGAIDLSVSGGVSPYTYTWNNSATTEDLSGLAAGNYNVIVSDANNTTSTASTTITEPTAIAIADAITNVSANGLSDGAIDITVSGGTSPYVFVWSNTSTTEDLSGLAAGSYSVTITDANTCSATANYTVTQPAGSLANMIITEIYYNGPESGTDSTEFIELQNIGNTSVSLNGYSFTSGITHTFSGGTVAPGAYFVIAIDSSGFRNTFGMNADAIWASGGLSNGGELIVLKDDFGRTVDSVDYDDSTPWPSGSSAGNPDGGGASIILCDSLADNSIGSNWSAAISPVSGVIVNGLQVFANPGMKGLCAAPMSIAVALDSNVTCNAGMNGGATVNVTGGLAPFTYAWSNSATTASITGVAAGKYYVTVTDALSTSLNDSVTITEPTAIVVTDAITNASANGLTDGAIDITVTGGTTPYTFVWSNAATTEDISGIGAGSYTVTVTDANACTSANTYSVTQPTTITLVDVITNVSCNGGADGSIALTTSGGVSPYTFVWSNAATTANISSLTAGAYNVTVTDANSATITASYTVTEPTALVISGNVTNATTFGGSDGSVSTTVTGGTSPYTYLWSNAATTATVSSLSAAKYYLTVTDANLCTKVDSFVVGQPAGAIASLVITEIMYNPAESGADTTEFIEFVNVGSTPVDMTGYNIVEGVVYAFNNLVVAPGQYVVGTVDSSGFRNRFGFDADFVWTSGGLSNGGEDITIVDNFGRTVDSVDFKDVAPWPSGSAAGLPDGGGSSIVLCDSTADNNVGSNWFAATSPVVGQIINGFQVYANPGVGAPCIQALVPTVVIDSNVTCNGLSNGGATVSATGGTAPYSFAWSNTATTASITGVAAGTYTVTITDAASTTIIDSAVITEPSAISFTSTIVDETSAMNDGSVYITVSGGTSPYTFIWSNAATTEDITGLAAGTYTVTITDANNCTFVDSAIVAFSVGLNKVVLNNSSVNIFPNPTKGAFTIETFAKYNQVTVMDITGKEVFTTNVFKPMQSIDLGQQEKGIYFIAIQGENGRVMKKVIVH